MVGTILSQVKMVWEDDVREEEGEMRDGESETRVSARAVGILMRLGCLLCIE